MLQRLIDHFLYRPMPFPRGEWQLQHEAGAEDWWLKTADDVDLHCWWFPNDGADCVTLFLHGNAGNVTHRVDHANAIKEAGSSVLVPDYRGYGRTLGRPTEAGVSCDAEAAYDELIRRGYSGAQIILHGESLGTAVATDLASRRECAGLILDAPFTSLAQMAGTIVPVVGPLLARGFDTQAKIGRVRVPLLIIHGDDDEIVPYAQGRALLGLANEPKSFWTVRGAHHNDLLEVGGDEYPKRLREFYQQLSKKDSA
jgi:fermentation-respiration switch protein FrsA (DUF1100 family)